MLLVILFAVAFVGVILISIKDLKFRGLFIFITGLVFLGAVFYHRVEGWSFLDAVYFCVATLATVGYGDFVPETAEGKIFTIFYIVFGIGAFLVFIDSIVASLQQKREEKKESKKKSA